MLDRVLEPEAMNTYDEAHAYDAMDHSEVNRKFADDFLALPRPDGEILDLGTGTALIPIELGRRDGDLQIVAVDLSANMLDIARANLALNNLTSRVRLERIDAKTLPYAAGRFAAVISNSIVHHIPEPAVALAEAWRVLAPGGRVFFRDLLRPADAATVSKLVSTYAGREDEQQRALFDASLRAALTLDEVRQLVSKLGADPAGVQATSDRHWTWTALKGAD